MTAEPTHDLLHGYVREVWGQRNLGALDRYLTPDYCRHVAPTRPPLDLAGQKELLKTFWAAFPDAELTVEDVVVAGQRLAFRSTVRGTHEGTYRGVAPTGRRVTVGLLDLIHVKDGRFAEQWGGPDLADLLRQLRSADDAPQAE